LRCLALSHVSHSRCTLLYPLFFFLMTPRPPRSPLFPYTTLFRSIDVMLAIRAGRFADAEALAAVCASRGAAAGDPDHEWWSAARSEEHTSELQSLTNLVCRLLLEKKKRLITHAPVRIAERTHM